MMSGFNNYFTTVKILLATPDIDVNKKDVVSCFILLLLD